MVGDETSTADEASASRRRPNVFDRFQRWVLVDGDRLLVAACISVGTFVFFLGLDWLGVISFANANSITRLASGMVAGTFSLVTLVVSINQLILSQEFTSAGAAEDRLEGVESFRSEVAKTIGDPVAPASPARILEELFASIHEGATALEDETDTLEGDTQEDVRRHVRAVESSTERALEILSGPGTETFDAVSVAVKYDVSRHLYTAKRLGQRHEGALSRPAREALDQIVADLELFTVAREHIKTTYLQRELTRFSLAHDPDRGSGDHVGVVDRVSVRRSDGGGHRLASASVGGERPPRRGLRAARVADDVHSSDGDDHAADGLYRTAGSRVRVGIDAGSTCTRTRTRTRTGLPVRPLLVDWGAFVLESVTVPLSVPVPAPGELLGESGSSRLDRLDYGREFVEVVAAARTERLAAPVDVVPVGE
ncbi:hypothetical protein ACFQMM_11365 [Saliphagus sp. GCM10025308]